MVCPAPSGLGPGLRIDRAGPQLPAQPLEQPFGSRAPAWKQTGRLRIRNDWVDTEISYGLMEEADQFPLTELMAGLQTPLLIFHGMKDDTVPYEHSLRLVQGATLPEIELHLLRTGDHRLSAWKEDIAESACAFLARHTSETRQRSDP